MSPIGICIDTSQISTSRQWMYNLLFPHNQQFSPCYNYCGYMYTRRDFHTFSNLTLTTNKVWVLYVDTSKLDCFNKQNKCCGDMLHTKNMK